MSQDLRNQDDWLLALTTCPPPPTSTGGQHAALWHSSFNLGSATRAGEGVIAPLVTVFVVVSAFVIARGWRRSDQLRPGSSTVPLSTR